jgi:hypothetical protein
LAVPPPLHVAGDWQVPHERTSLQPSEMVPQLAPVFAHVVGVQVPLPQTFGLPPPPQTCEPEQLPHVRRKLQPFWITGRRPQFLPSDSQVMAAQPSAGWQAPETQCPFDEVQSAQAAPLLPQTSSAAPLTQSPSEVQQP